MTIDQDLTHFDHLKLRHLKLLELVHDHSSLRKVAELLCVSQPAVTVMLRELEKQFGATLVDRSPSGVELTAAGALVRERLRIAIQEIATARAAIQRSGEAQLLRIGAFPAAMIELVPMGIARMGRRGGLPQILIQEGGVDVLSRALERGTVDCIIGRISAGEHAVQDQFEYEVLGSESLNVICGAQHLLASSSHVTLQVIADAQWVLPPTSLVSRRVFEQVFIRAGIRPPPATIESASFYSNINIVIHNDLLAIVPGSAMRMFERSKLIRKLPVDLIGSGGPNVVLISRRTSKDLPVLAAFREGLQAAASALDYRGVNST